MFESLSLTLLLVVLPSSDHQFGLRESHRTTVVTTTSEGRGESTHQVASTLDKTNWSSPFSDSSLIRVVSSQPTTVAEWQRQYDDALRRRNSGSSKAKLGLLITVGGLVLTLAGAAQASDADFDGGGGGLMTLGLVADLVGSGVWIWGLGQRGGAREDMETLERLRSSMKRPVPSGGFLLGAGNRPALAYRLSW